MFTWKRGAKGHSLNSSVCVNIGSWVFKQFKRVDENVVVCFAYDGCSVLNMSSELLLPWRSECLSASRWVPDVSSDPPFCIVAGSLALRRTHSDSTSWISFWKLRALVWGHTESHSLWRVVECWSFSYRPWIHANDIQCILGGECGHSNRSIFVIKRSVQLLEGRTLLLCDLGLMLRKIGRIFFIFLCEQIGVTILCM